MLRILCLSICVLSLSSCSWFSNRQTLFDNVEAETQPGAEKKEKETAMKAYVPRAQYDKLLREYEMLKHQNQMANAINKPTTDQKLIDDIKKVGEPEENSLSATVDVAAKKEVQIAPVTTFKSDKDSEIAQLNRAIALVDQKKYDQALGLLNPLDRSETLAIRARAIFYIGELLFDQKEYDLAMQKFERLLTSASASGLVLDTLGRLIVCTDKLKLKEKYERYSTLFTSLGIEL